MNDNFTPANIKNTYLIPIKIIIIGESTHTDYNNFSSIWIIHSFNTERCFIYKM